jgi:signal transduction histidine kinase
MSAGQTPIGLARETAWRHASAVALVLGVLLLAEWATDAVTLYEHTPPAGTLALRGVSFAIVLGGLVTLLHASRRRVASETRLDARNALLTALVNSPRDTIIFALDRDYRYTAFNDRHAEEMRRVWVADIAPGVCLLDLMTIPEVRALARHSIDRALRGEAFVEIQHQPAPSVYYELQWAPVRLRGEIVGVTAFIRDVTAQRETQDALLLARADLERRVGERTAELESAKRLLDETGRLARVGGWEIDLVAQTLSWTDEVYRIHEVEPGYRPTLEEGIAFYAPEAVPVLAEAVRRAGQDGTAFDLELPFITAKGRRLWVRAVGQAYRREDAIIKVGGVFQDVTSRRVAVDELRQHAGWLAAANSELEAFSYSVSHDLRAPLRAIDGFAHILTTEHSSQLTEEGRRVLAVISTEAARMNQLIDDLLTFSKMGRQPMLMTGLDLGAMTREVFAECAARTGSTASLRLEGPIPLAFGDRPMVRQVLVNLVSNAVKFTATTRPATVIVEGRREGKDVVFTIRDNGVGFDMRYAAKLFRVFQRLHTTSEFEGTGVGLALVHRIIQRHGGRVWAEGAVGEGAAFHFTLPPCEIQHD